MSPSNAFLINVIHPLTLFMTPLSIRWQPPISACYYCHFPFCNPQRSAAKK